MENTQNQDKKLICLDLDGTTLNNQKELSPLTIKTLKKLQELGHKIVLFTGRNLRTSLYYYEKLGLDTLLVNTEGAYISNPSLNKTLMYNTKSFLNGAKNNQSLKQWFNFLLRRWENSIDEHFKNNGLKFVFNSELAKQCYKDTQNYFLASITLFANCTKISVFEESLQQEYAKLKQSTNKKTFRKELVSKILASKNNQDSLLLTLLYELFVYLGYVSLDPFYYTSSEFLEKNIGYFNLENNKEDVLGTLFVLRKDADINELIAFIKDKYPTLNVTYYQGFNGYVIVSITSFYATKKQALRYVCSYYGIALKNVYSFGDSSNDVEILKKTHEYSRSFAVSNASSEAKSKASVILPYSNNEDAVAKKLIELFNLQENKLEEEKQEEKTSNVLQVKNTARNK